ncbi:efflux RND transporter periplasmic adaptor subunit [Rhizosphaericola mali]|uniref:Efflux RND transporter periplasmic adaptor subunit n=1 Tax=Rhizosphaericola mali TaxID=2545455 RepID=A0A5P2G163_9BACT|nr:efflux RND transporter periplasmic adaptor subunit [Rhizosphaericola mali]QES87572.1 efflux RND transporter periplasmic adaptor subunit [Rhizosphaericola mali]
MFLQQTKNIIGLSLFVVLASCGNKSDKAGAASMMPDPNAPVFVTDTVVGASDATFGEQYPGSVTAFQQVNLTPQVTGYITGIHFKDGQRVTKGQLLYSIDQEVYNANLSNAQATIAVQEAAVVKAQQDYNRYHELEKNDAIAKQQVDYADAALVSAQKQLAAAKASARSLNSNVRFTKIYAPFSGTVGISQVRMGMAVFAGQTVLNTISTNNPIAVDFNVDQTLLNRFTELQKSQAKAFKISLGADSVYGQLGSVALIDRAADMQTGTVKVRLTFQNDKDLLKPGMNATVLVGDNKQSILIPSKAIFEQLGEFSVYVIGDSDKVAPRALKLGANTGVYTAVLSGLNAGDKIVVDGTQKLHAGSKITTTPPTPPAAQGGKK